MFKQIIKPETKEDLIIHLPEEFIGKKIEVEANEMKKVSRKKSTRKIKTRAQRVAEMFKRFDKHLVSTKNFKFNRDEANER